MQVLLAKLNENKYVFDCFVGWSVFFCSLRHTLSFDLKLLFPQTHMLSWIHTGNFQAKSLTTASVSSYHFICGYSSQHLCVFKTHATVLFVHDIHKCIHLKSIMCVYVTNTLFPFANYEVVRHWGIQGLGSQLKSS